VGASVCLLKPGGEKEPMEIVNTIQKHKVTTMHFVPSMLSIFLSTLSEKELLQLRSLRQVFSSGEALKASHVKLFATTVHKHWGTDLINLYGPTEATVDVTYYKCSFEEDGLTIPIGKPIDNTWLYVLDKSGRLCPIGVSGELCIGGVGVARGYLNNTSLTEQKFVADPFVQEQKIYRTGDLTRWLPDGTIEYLGRIDHQVKLRGFRIELEEIEYQLSAYPSIKESVVALKGEEEDKFLVGYYVSDKELNTAELRNHLLGKLPEYMVPAYFLRIDNIPLSVNGKANKKALPDPDKIQVTGKAAPQNELEQQLLSLWQQVLPAGNITTDVDFFSAGGNSIKLIRLFKLISDNTPYKVEVRNLFEHRTITAIAAFIAHKYNEQPRDIIKKKNIIEF
jgi:acyl-CoA synthetase (AMP-forming)/AMP-acid ligase II